MRVDQGAALAERAQRQIEANEVVDRAAARAVPRAARQRHNSERGERRAFVTSHGQDSLTGAKRGVGRRRYRKAVGLKAQHGNIGGRIAPGKRCLDQAPTRQSKFDVLVLLQNFFGGDDDT